MITIVMSTYAPQDKPQRKDYAKRCINALSKKLVGSTLNFHIADDGSPESNLRDLIICADHYFGSSNVSYSQSNRKGIGGSLNLALSQIKGWWMYSPDDVILTDTIQLRPVLVLLEEFKYDMVRLGPIHPNLQCTTKFNTMAGWYLEIDQAKGGYSFSIRPFVATPNFYNTVGPFNEGLNAYETERLYNERVARSNVKIASIDLGGPWTHIGEVEVGDIDPKINLG
jgi:hypothetical protein